ncbi:hypothetical protein [Cellvibrio sp. NN19]|uniref:hypothetical protein n=1 Tax=Cellvibrio chitinivorans TaxID=3102792 RepID=UPI002B40E844|nr:hypothetical protein [Cellvibrio sp. NN19]
MMLRKLLRNRGLGLNLIAGACFILLLVNGWGLSWRELGGYLLALVILLGGVIALAAFCGWVLHKVRRGRKESFDLPEKTDSEQHSESELKK